MRIACLPALLLVLLAPPAQADEISVAVAANFYRTAQALAERFEAQTGHRVTLSSGSTGKHYAQIQAGAPFDVFLAADTERPRKLVTEKRALRDFDYAQGRLWLWLPDSPAPASATEAAALLTGESIRRIAIANPALAPYGAAAMEALESLGILVAIEGRLVRGQNVAQAYQFLATGNADAGFIALSMRNDSSGWLVPPELHTPIVQAGALLNNSEAAADFVDFLLGDEGQALLARFGYDSPPES